MVVGLLYISARFLDRVVIVLAAEHYVKRVFLVMGSDLKTGAFTKADKEDHLKARSNVATSR